MRIYMDACCYCRPFDDLTDDKVNLEAEAVIAILSKCEKNIYSLYSSKLIEYEISKITDVVKMDNVKMLVSISNNIIPYNKHISKRAKEIQKAGVKLFDSLHLAITEYGNCDFLLTTDYKFLKKADGITRIKLLNPIHFFAGGEEFENNI